jgi:hypothetical protein
MPAQAGGEVKPQRAAWGGPPVPDRSSTRVAPSGVGVGALSTANGLPADAN